MARDEWEWLDHVPKVKMYPEPKKRVRWITREEAARLITELPSHLADLAAFTLATGLQAKERHLSQVGPTGHGAWHGLDPCG